MSRPSTSDVAADEYVITTSPERDKGGDGLTYHHILLPTVMYFIIVFALFPLQIQVIIQAICDNKGNDDDDGECDSSEISSRAAIINTYCSIALYLPIILLTGTVADSFILSFIHSHFHMSCIHSSPPLMYIK
jgi:hypothetical protein